MSIRIFFDTEFTGLRKDTTLISIGLISETGEQFYAELSDYDRDQVKEDPFIEQQVISKLRFKEETENRAWEEVASLEEDHDDRINCVYGDTEFVREHLEIWLDRFDKCLMVSDCLAYDWVLFCNLWGHALKIPKKVYYIPMDLCTLFLANAIDPDVTREHYAYNDINIRISPDRHNALYDAKIIKMCFERLYKYDASKEEILHKHLHAPDHVRPKDLKNTVIGGLKVQWILDAMEEYTHSRINQQNKRIILHGN